MKARFGMLSLAALLIVVDQCTKFLINQARPNFQVIPGFFTLRYVENTGAAFGILQGRQLLLTSVSVLAIGILLFLIFYEHEGRTGLIFALALILGGTCGNLIDRIRLGYVIDFLEFHIKQYYWPSFNVADSAISIGVGMLILVMLWEDRRKRLGS